MPSSRLLAILQRVNEAGRDGAGTTRLCEVCADVATMTGAGIMLMAGDVAGSLCSSDEVSALIEDLQYTLGEGPCVDAFRDDQPVAEPDLGRAGAARWAAFAPPALEAGAQAVFGFPLQAGPARLGALNLYRDRPGPLSDAQHGDALLLSGVVARWVLVMQAEAPPESISGEIEAGADLRFVVHQATGMVSAQLGVAIPEALIRLRAHAFAADRSLRDVACDVVARRLRFG